MQILRVIASKVRILPPPPTPQTMRRIAAGIAQLVERQPSKLNVTGSNPVSRSTLALAAAQETKTSAHLAQSVEHVLGKDEVTSSILVVGSSFNEANEGTEP